MTYEEPETAHFYALLFHFKAAGCCLQCRQYYAILSIEKAAGRPAPEEPVCLDATPESPSRCAERARAAWQARPKVPTPVAPSGHVPASAGPQSNAVKPSPGQIAGAATRDTQRGTREHRNPPISAGSPAGAPGVGGAGKVGPAETGAGPGVRAT